MTTGKSSARARKSAMTRAEYDARVEQIGIAAGSRFGRGNVALRNSHMLTRTKFERGRAAMLTQAGIKFEKN